MKKPFACLQHIKHYQKFFCCVYETKEEHEYMLGDCSWVYFCFKKIMNEVDFNFITHLLRERLLEHFREKDEVDITLRNYDFYMKEGYLNEMKKKLKSYVLNQ